MSEAIWRQSITIVGLGLMGGSLALALRPYVSQLTAVDSDPSTRQQALQQGVVDQVAATLAAGAAQARLIILATPVRTIAALLDELARLRPDGCLVLDLGSVKGAICRKMDDLPPAFQALGGHPMCGRETSGLAAATADLYAGQTFVFCRTRRTTAGLEALARQMAHLIGARPLFLEPDRHDRIVALTSHLPYLTAALLMAQAAGAAGDEAALWPVSAAGFRDSARLSGSDPRMMLDILLSNRPAVLAQLDHYQANLSQLRALLAAADEAALAHWLAARQVEHHAYRQQKENPELAGGGD